MAASVPWEQHSFSVNFVVNFQSNEKATMSNPETLNFVIEQY